MSRSRRVRRPAALTAGLLGLSLLASGCGFLGIGGDEPGDIQVYSARHYDLEDAFVEFEEETGLKADGDDSPADVYVTVDAGNLWTADEQGELVPVDSQVLEDSVPEEYRDSQDRWFGLALRARTVAYNPDKVDKDLAKWLQVGVSPRGVIGLDKVSRAHAWLNGRDYVTPDDVQATVHDVFRHRLVLSYEAHAGGTTANQVIDRIVELVAVA